MVLITQNTLTEKDRIELTTRVTSMVLIKPNTLMTEDKNGYL